VVILASAVAALAGVIVAAATIALPDLRGGEKPCFREGFRVDDCVSGAEVAAIASINFAIVAAVVFVTIIVLSLLSGIAWRLLKWAMSG